jgi:tRNA A37 threonylcarbamoyladenosine modification protein TsaB
MIENFLILNCIGQTHKIGLRIKNNFYFYTIEQKENKHDYLVLNILNLLKKHKVILDNKFSIIVNIGPGNFSSIRTSLSIVKGMKISRKINLYGFNNADLEQFDQVNIELLIDKGLLQNKLIKPIYLS